MNNTGCSFLIVINYLVFSNGKNLKITIPGKWNSLLLSNIWYLTSGTIFISIFETIFTWQRLGWISNCYICSWTANREFQIFSCPNTNNFVFQYMSFKITYPKRDLGLNWWSFWKKSFGSLFWLSDSTYKNRKSPQIFAT